MWPGSRAAAAKRPFVTARKAFLSPWTGCDKEREMRENGLSGSFEFCYSLNIVGFLG